VAGARSAQEERETELCPYTTVWFDLGLAQEAETKVQALRHAFARTQSLRYGVEGERE
jgi:hypothetical protein